MSDQSTKPPAPQPPAGAPTPPPAFTPPAEASTPSSAFTPQAGASTPPSAFTPPAGASTPSPAFTPPPFTPPAAGTFPAGGPAMIEPVKPSTKKIVLRKLLVAAIALIAFIVIGTVWSVMSGDPSIASTGDCLIGQSSDDIKVVDCGDAAAEWTVLDEVENVRDDDFDAAGENYTGCAAHPTVEAWFWSGEGHNGDVLCLEPIKK